MEAEVPVEVSETFETLLSNLKLDNDPIIVDRRDQITKALNTEFRSTESLIANRLMVGSYGRYTAIRGVSDIDLLYILPSSLEGEYNSEDGPRKVLERVREAIHARYTKTSIKVDRLVVVVQFTNFKFEVQPVFKQADGSFSYPDTYAKKWKTTKPSDEIEELKARNDITHGNLRKLCRYARAWKNKHGVAINGLLIDTLAYNFVRSTSDFDSVGFGSHDRMVREFFQFLADEPTQDRYAAVGSGQHVKVKARFQSKARTALALCDEAIAAGGKAKANTKWREVFGAQVPLASDSLTASASLPYRDTEEFIEDQYPVDISHTVTIDCTVTQDGFRTKLLRQMLAEHKWLSPRKHLDFRITETSVAEPYTVRWKVLNRGDEAEARDCVRGQIDGPNRDKSGRHEQTSFRGEHYVEVYILKSGVVVARDGILVPIEAE